MPFSPNGPVEHEPAGQRIMPVVQQKLRLCTACDFSNSEQSERTASLVRRALLKNDGALSPANTK